jgi:hypothetical protein
MPDSSVVTLNATIRPDQDKRLDAYKAARGKVSKSEALRELLDTAFASLDAQKPAQPEPAR